MNKHIVSGIAIAIALFTASVPARAVPITYTLQNVTFTDGTKATGSFVFDANTHQSSAYSISTTAGLLSAFTWDKFDSGLYYGGGAGPNNFTLITFNGNRVFNFSFINALTNAGGTYAINIASTYECNNCGTFRRVNGGTVTSAAVSDVPEPGTATLMAAAIGALGIATRRRKQATV